MPASFRAEWLKMRRLWLPAIAVGAGLIVLLLVSLNLNSAASRVATERNLEVPWQAGAIGDAAVTMNLVLPALVIILTALCFYVEHRSDMWKQLRATPQPIWTIYAAKFLVVQMLVALALTVAAAGAVGGWTLLPDMFRRELAGSAAEAILAVTGIAAGLYLSLLPLSALQFLLSARMANILYPVGIGLVLTFANLLAMSPATGPWLPYAYPGALIISRFPPPEPAQQQTDLDYRAPLDAFAGAARGGGAIVIDEAHGNRHGLGSVDEPGTLRWLAGPAQSAELPLRPSAARLRRQTLRGVRLLILGSASQPFTPEEVDAVTAWVEGGGSLLLLTDHEPFASPASGLASRFGVRFSRETLRPDRGSQGARIRFDRKAGGVGRHEMARGADRVVTYGGQALWRTNPQTIRLLPLPRVMFGEAGQRIDTSGAAQLMAFPFGRGRVVMSGEAGLFTAQRDADGSRIGVADSGTDNERLVLGAVRWLLRLPRGPR
jgi:hypothetical protein